MRCLKLYFMSVIDKFILNQIMLTIFVFLGMSVSMKLEGLLMLLIPLVLCRIDRQSYELMAHLPNKTKDVIKLCYLSAYTPIIVGFILFGIFEKSDILQIIYHLTWMIVYINIIIPIFYKIGMKRNELGVIGLASLVMIMGFYGITYFFSTSVGLSATIIGIILSLGTLLLSYKISIRRIYGR